MTPYIKNIVELHKIHKAIENCDYNKKDDSGGESGSNSNIFFEPASIQPKYLIKSDPNNPETTPELINIEDFTLEIGEYILIYDKEDVISLGINENDLDSLTPVSLQDIFSTSDMSNSLQINNDIAENNIIFCTLGYIPYPNINGYALIMVKLTDSYDQTLNNIYLFKVENDNMFMFIMRSSQTPIDPD